MGEGKVKKIKLLDKSVVKVVEELRVLAGKKSSAESAQMALDGMLEGFVQQARMFDDLDDEVAVDQLKELAEVFHDSPLPWLHLSEVYLGRDDFKKAKKAAEQGLKIEPGEEGLVFNRALALQELGDYDAAIVGFKHCIEVNPYDPWAYSNIGDAYRMLKKYDQAEQHLHEALEIEPHFAPALHNLALLHNDREQWAACVYFGEQALRYEPDDAEVHLAMGDALLSLKEQEAALQHLAAATLIDPDFVEAYESMSDAYAELDMYELCVGAAREALKRDPTSWMALANIGYGYGRQGRFAEAIAVYQDVLKMVTDPKRRSEVLWELGWDCFEADQYEQALDYTQKSIDCQKQPKLILFFNKGLMLLALGRVDEAEETYRQAMERAEAEEDHEALAEASKDLGQFLARKAVDIEPDSAMSKLLRG
jgi:tetratricopeptide (TPR) repeat protein